MANVSTNRRRALVVWMVWMLCGVVAAGLIAAITALITVVLHGDAMEIFMVAGTTFGTCLTLEVALASLYLAVRRGTL